VWWIPVCTGKRFDVYPHRVSIVFTLQGGVLMQNDADWLHPGFRMNLQHSLFGVFVLTSVAKKKKTH
jgi:hypothetical protein